MGSLTAGDVCQDGERGTPMSDVYRKPERSDLREASCDRCNQTFVPASPEDLLHLQRRDGELCGGQGRFFRPFVIRDPNRW